MPALSNTLCAAIAAIPPLASATAQVGNWRAWQEGEKCYVQVTAQGAPATFGFFRSRSAAAIFYSEPPGPWTASDRVMLRVEHDAPIAAFATRQTERVAIIGIPSEQDRERLVADLYSGTQLTVTTAAGARRFALKGVDSALAEFDACIKTLPGGSAP